MIDPDKTYRTRDGRPVRIYATDGPPSCPVHGAIDFSDAPAGQFSSRGWKAAQWDSDGRNISHNNRRWDLIEATLADKLTEQIPWEALCLNIQWVAWSPNQGWKWSTHKMRLHEESCTWQQKTTAATWGFISGVNMPTFSPKYWNETLCKRPEGR